ncbi:PDZ domain-containing protein [Nesterenkonia sp. HG001]|uniref:YlbL family protein n=1 Tax=Nesterenkonia sp. HG001 TaxID=2983207 RepID=UPI002AC78388|nr:S16 family serine protease [Nesterenkonia sp. HG001]MDZ5076281.1 PDZ domain-containing protein [Nesterenkonia sp. HG001]
MRLGAGLGAVVLGAALLGTPAPYLTEAPGPVFNTIGEFGDEPMISISGQDTHPTEGALSMTTVFVNGAPTSTVYVPQVIKGWLDPSVDVMPQELVYPSGTTAEDVRQMNTAAMTSSQDLATAAALDALDIDHSQRLRVIDFTPQAADVGTTEVLEVGDEVLAAEGEPVTGVEGLREVVNDAAGQPVELTVTRDGEDLDVEVPTYQEADGDYYVGILLQGDFDFPVDVEITLEDVGGPSAGLMFTLGIIDHLTETSMTGGEDWAGTGTVDPDGTVGPIGGIAQKVVGARDAGADHFLVPRENCAELEGRVPRGLEVHGVDDVDQARQVVEAVRDADDALLESLESCGS